MAGTKLRYSIAILWLHTQSTSWRTVEWILRELLSTENWNVNVIILKWCRGDLQKSLVMAILIQCLESFEPVLQKDLFAEEVICYWPLLRLYTSRWRLEYIMWVVSDRFLIIIHFSKKMPIYKFNKGKKWKEIIKRVKKISVGNWILPSLKRFI